MELHEFALDQLQPHPQNSNVMPEALLMKLATHIQETDRYPPVIVRPLSPEAAGDQTPAATAAACGKTPGGTSGGASGGTSGGGGYQIIDGHHRVEALRRIGQPTARCVVWDVDDAGALLLLATLNRLQGQDDPRKRAALVGQLHEHLDLKALSAKLPEDSDRLRKLMRMNEGMPTPRPPQRSAICRWRCIFSCCPPSGRRSSAGCAKSAVAETVLAVLPRLIPGALPGVLPGAGVGA